MNERKFLIEGNIVGIQPGLIKKYYAYPECFFKDNNELYVFNGKIYKSEEGEYCNGLDCSVSVPEQIFDQEGKAVCTNAEDFVVDSVEGFIYNKKLYLINELEEVW